MAKSVLHMFSSRSFIVSGLTLKLLNHFGFVFVYDMSVCSDIDLHVAVQLSQYYLAEETFSQCIFFSPLLKISCP